jgi:hypothetical protein
MDPTVTRRFALIARPRPTCAPLDQRVSELREHAEHAQQHHDAASATAVFNLAALLASDCGLPDLARTWCHRLATSAITHNSNPRHALEPVVNLARLHIRAGNGNAAWTLLETLFHAVDTRTDTTIDGLTIPAALLTATPETHTTTRTWLWTVLLGTGAHALATAGRWDDASTRLHHYKGVGARMLDGRQVAVIAHAIAGRHQQARAMLNATQPGRRWENAVSACLHLHVPAEDPTEKIATALSTHHALGAVEPELTVFRTRLGLTLIDALDSNQPTAQTIAQQLIRDAAQDGYAARDLLTHPVCRSIATNSQIEQLTELVTACGLARGALSAPHLATLLAALDQAESVIATQGARRPHQPA